MPAFSFSYSKYSTYKKCPLQYKLKNIDKVDTGPTPKALIEGRKLHDEMKDYLIGKTDVLPKRAEKFSILAAQMRKLQQQGSNSEVIIVEDQMAFDEHHLRVKWFGKNARYRFIWDAAILNHEENTLFAVDWKTGKPYGSYDDQMEIFSIPAFWLFPEVTKFVGYLAYLDAGEMSEPYVYTREQFENAVWPKWRTEISLFESDTRFEPTPSKSACRFCDFGPNNLGICQHAIS
jgi:hypothetical protein